MSATLDELAIPWMVIGGVAVIASGVPRETIDIDVAVLGRVSDLDVLLATLERNGITPRIEGARQFARERQVLLLQHESSGVTMELSFAWLPFEEEALARARRIDVVEIARMLEDPERVRGFDTLVARAKSTPC